MSFFQTLFDGSLMPHGHCLLWRGDLLFLHVGGDALTVFSYFAIPPALLYLRQKREDLAVDTVFLLFAALIFLCGVTHLVNIINVWQGFYFIEGLTKMATGLVSAVTAIMVWVLLPQVLKLPTMGALMTNSEVLSRSQDDILAAREQLAQLEEKIKERKSVLNGLNQ